ncbi:PPP1R11/YPI1 family protein [Sporobolomyces salmoneus]|uniref:PPP1R11/YPI1 family protein n=1 Tax=Sporobolomyces salmoneus TaxID=183962 RepID=UPI00317C9FFF
MQATRPSNTAPASHGSRTLTVTDAPPQPEAGSSSSAPDPAPSLEGTVRVRGTGQPGQRVQFTAETVDNEGLGRKKSKICCIYHKPKEFDESSDESDSSGEDSDSSIGSADSREARPQPSSRRRRHRHHHHHHDGDCNHGASEGGSTTRSNGGGSQTVVELPPTPIPNAYERQPGTGGDKGKGKA